MFKLILNFRNLHSPQFTVACGRGGSQLSTAGLCVPADWQHKGQEFAPLGLSANFAQTYKNWGKAFSLPFPNLWKRIAKYGCHKEQSKIYSSYTKWGCSYTLISSPHKSHSQRVSFLWRKGSEGPDSPERQTGRSCRLGPTPLLSVLRPHGSADPGLGGGPVPWHQMWTKSPPAGRPPWRGHLPNELLPQVSSDFLILMSKYKKAE